MTLVIPSWLLWTLGLGLGIPLAISILVLAFHGCLLVIFLKDWRLL